MKNSGNTIVVGFFRGIVRGSFLRGEIEIDLEGDWGELDSLYKCFHTPTIHQINRFVNNYFCQLAKCDSCRISEHDKMNITF